MAANDGAVQLYQRVGFRPWLLELAAPLDDDPARTPPPAEDVPAAPPRRSPTP